MYLTFFAVTDIRNIFYKAMDFVENLEMMHIVGGGGEGVMLSAYKNR